MWTYNSNNNYLMHFGVKGMKWGVRRYQNKDGSLTPAGKKKVSKQYKREMIKYQKDSRKNEVRLNANAYNKTANEYNNGKIDEFNRTHKVSSKTYYEDYVKQFEHDYRTNFDKMKLSEMENNKHYVKAKQMCDKYGMVKFDKLAQDNEKFVSDIKKNLKKGKTSWDITN